MHESLKPPASAQSGLEPVARVRGELRERRADQRTGQHVAGVVAVGLLEPAPPHEGTVP